MSVYSIPFVLLCLQLSQEISRMVCTFAYYSGEIHKMVVTHTKVDLFVIFLISYDLYCRLKGFFFHVTPFVCSLMVCKETKWKNKQLTRAWRLYPLSRMSFECHNTVKTSIFWDVTVCSVENCLHSGWLLSWVVLHPWRWRRHIPVKCRLTFNRLYTALYPKRQNLS
jgi:hypothetical protein